MRLAWFTPLSPARSGLAAHGAGRLAQLAADFEVDAYVDEADPAVLAARLPPRVAVRPAHEFPWRHARDAYDLTVYDLADAAGHDYAWGYAIRHPGLAVLHDTVLHHARAGQLLRRGRLDDYRAELRFDRPDREPDICAIAGAGVPHVLAEWPLLGALVAASRLAVVADARAAADLRRRYPGARIDAVRFGAADPLAAAASPSDAATPAGAMPNTRAKMRAADASPSDAATAAGARGAPAGDPLMFAVCPPTAAVRRLDLILDAFAALPPAPPTRLHVLGPVADPGAARARIDALGLARRVRLTAGADPDAALRETDVCICLAWPPAGETTPLWVRCLAAGKPTIVGPSLCAENVPLLDPRTWRHRDGGPEAGVAVAVDPLEETDTLALAMRRLAADPARRAALGRRARRYWEQAHRDAAMARDYRRVIRTAAATPAPRPDGLPAHLRADGLAHARGIAGRMDVTVDFLDPTAAS